MKPFHPQCHPILIGSLPVADHQEAIAMVFQATPRVPVWPQLPVHPQESMVAQFAPGMPGLREEDGRIYVDLGSGAFENELAAFYEEYLAVVEQSAPLETSRFVLGDAAAGFYALKGRVAAKDPFVAIKGQVTGPITFGLGLKDQQGRAVYYDANARDAAVKLLAMKAAYQVRTFKDFPCPVIIFQDEPALAGYSDGYRGGGPVARRSPTALRPARRAGPGIRDRPARISAAPETRSPARYCSRCPRRLPPFGVGA